MVETARFPDAEHLRAWVAESPTASDVPDQLTNRVVRTIARRPATAETVVAAIVTSAHDLGRSGTEANALVATHALGLAAALLDEGEWDRLVSGYPGFGAPAVA